VSRIRDRFFPFFGVAAERAIEAAPKPHVETAPPQTPHARAPLFGVFWDAVEGRHELRALSHAKKTAEAVLAHEPEMSLKTAGDLYQMTGRFREVLADQTAREREAVGAARADFDAAPFHLREEKRRVLERAEEKLYRLETKVLHALLPEAYAAVREAARRTSGEHPYREQVIAAVLLEQGALAQMYTGEGKTLAAVMPAYLAALAGRGFHVVTANDYLARRDAEKTAKVLAALGVSVGVVAADSNTAERREAYLADVTYATAQELGFDWLRDRSVREVSERVQRKPYGALLDEADAILIDDARTPLIISSEALPPNVPELERYRDIAEVLDWKSDVEWNVDEHWAGLTNEGAKKAAVMLGCGELYSIEYTQELRGVQDALKAQYVFRKDRHYVVSKDRVLPVGNNGHALEGQRFGRGIHQALEAKERVTVQPEQRASASVTLRDYFSMYPRCAGMTGTAFTARGLFSQLYGLEVVRVPLRSELKRVDREDRLFETIAEKKAAFLQHIVAAHALGRPIIAGVEHPKTAEELARSLLALGVHAEVLTAKDDGREAEIIAQAGQIGAVTIVTARGGRGVDVRLDERAKVLGGLLVLAYEHFDSQRRDDQLRGRTARHGEPGETVFYVARDEAARTGSIEEELKSAMQLDRVMADHRRRIYELRDDLLALEDPRGVVEETIRTAIDDLFEGIGTLAPATLAGSTVLSEALSRELYAALRSIVPLPAHGPPPEWSERELLLLREDVQTFVDAVQAKRRGPADEVYTKLHEKGALLDALDEAWTWYLDQMADLRHGIAFRTYGMRDPENEFQREAWELFDNTLDFMRHQVTSKSLREQPAYARF
jgi:preprotein translocase subunit SecA